MASKRAAAAPTQAAGIVFRTGDDGPRILLVTARRDPSLWIFPKGKIEPGESPGEAALREVREESGVEGVLVGPAGPPLEFPAGGEPVRVQHFLVSATQDRESPEGRAKRWLQPVEALATLSFDASREVLRAALPDIESREPGDRGSLRDLLLAEYKHTADALLRNEEHGEKRVTFLIAVVGVAATLLGVFLGSGAGIPLELRQPVVAGAIGVVFIFGCITLARMVKRDVASDRYKLGLNRIRRYFVASRDDPGVRFLAFDPFSDKRRKPRSRFSIGDGGWLPTVALVDALLLGAFGAALTAHGPLWLPVAVGPVAAAIGWITLIGEANRRYAKEMKPPV